MLGISPHAWDEAREVMGEDAAAVTVAAILQRAEHIKAPGGYLRALVERKRRIHRCRPDQLRATDLLPHGSRQPAPAAPRRPDLGVEGLSGLRRPSPAAGKD